ncbi:MAG: hypothetical protein MHM6MM_008536 [Cercozoa sp. M6MM]
MPLNVWNRHPDVEVRAVAPEEAQAGTKRAQSELNEDADVLEIMPIGAGQEVGRSCILLKFRRRHIMLDCGLHPGLSGMAALPFFDVIDPTSLDAILITHFHIDHAAALPYFLARNKGRFRGKVYMTHATKSVFRLLMLDYLRVSGNKALFTEAELNACLKRVTAVDFHQTVRPVAGVKFQSFFAGHVLGAAMFFIEIGGVKILYTGDYSCHADRHLAAAEIPPERPDVLISESTFGVMSLEPAAERERRFLRYVSDVVERGGKCLIPVFATGRAQELMLLLEEHWRDNPALQQVPIFYYSALANRALDVYRRYVHTMNASLVAQAQTTNPFNFRFIRNLGGRASSTASTLENQGEACVVFATPGMLQSGLSRRLFERWCGDRRNACIIPGYCVEGTLAKTLKGGHLDAVESAKTGARLPLRMPVHFVTFAAHADFRESSSFIRQLQPSRVVLVHGEKSQVAQFSAALRRMQLRVLTPRNTQKVHLVFRADTV